MVLSLEEPISDPACLNVMLISHLAKKNGISVLLSGASGDDIFSGYRRHQAIYLDNIIKYFKSMSRMLQLKSGENVLNKLKLPRTVMLYLDGIHLDGDQRLFNYFKWSNSDEIIGVFNNDLNGTRFKRKY